MWPTLTVVDLPPFNLLSGIAQRDKNIGGQTLVAGPPVETLNHPMLHGFSRSDHIQLHLVGISPGIQRLQGKFAPIVLGDDLWVATLLCRSHEGGDHLLAGQGEVWLDYLTVPTLVIHDRARQTAAHPVVYPRQNPYSIVRSSASEPTGLAAADWRVAVDVSAALPTLTRDKVDRLACH